MILLWADEAVIFVGVQGSGKTTFYLERFADTHLRISLDMLRTRRREQILFAACLEAGQPFVIDNTNPLPADRARYIGPAKAAGFRVLGYSFDTSVRDAIQRNNRRAGRKRVPVPAVVATFRKLQAPTLSEGFDALYVVAASAEGRFRVQDLTKSDTNQP